MKQNRKIGIVILAVSLLIISVIAFLFLDGVLNFNGVNSSFPHEETTIFTVITQGGISVFEDSKCRESVQTINLGKVESHHQYSQTVYVRNDNQEQWLDSGKRDIVWQRDNVNPDSVYISIKISYGDAKLSPNEVRQVNITLTVLGVLEESNRLNQNASIPQFTFDLVLKGQDLSLFTYTYIHLHALRDANNITTVYEDDLKETISVTIEVGIWKTVNGEQVMEVVWSSTKYTSEFTETWLGAERYLDYQLVVTVYHERYGEFQYKNYLIGQLP